MTCVIIESPHSGNLAENVPYAETCLRHSLRIGESPVAFHLLYPRVLDDNDSHEREMGLGASVQWYLKASLVALYVDLGISPGMLRGAYLAAAARVPVELRALHSVSKCGVCQLPEGHKGPHARVASGKLFTGVWWET